MQFGLVRVFVLSGGKENVLLYVETSGRFHNRNYVAYILAIGMKPVNLNSIIAKYACSVSKMLSLVLRQQRTMLTKISIWSWLAFGAS